MDNLFGKSGVAVATVGSGAQWLPRRRTRLQQARFVALATALLVGGLILVAILAPVIAPQDPYRQALGNRLAPPSLTPEGGKLHLLGTDHLGRDVFSRVIFGSRVSLTVGFSAVLIGGVVGSALGLIAGFIGGYLDEGLMMAADAQLALPNILLAIAIIAVLGPSLPNLIVVVGISGWVTYARVVRGQVLSIKEKDFVAVARALGGRGSRILLRHILPNTVPSLIVIATLDLARTIILESTLSFLGLGVQPPTPSWGGMMNEGREYLDSAWWLATFPGVVLMCTALGISRIGDWLRDLLDPTLRGS